MLLNQGYVPCDKQIHIKIPENELQMIRDRMKQIGVKNMSAYIRKMAIRGIGAHSPTSKIASGVHRCTACQFVKCQKLKGVVSNSL